MNKFCTVRPQLVLHTVEYEPQTDGLTVDDFEAAMDALRQMGDDYMVIFNGGKDAGASVGRRVRSTEVTFAVPFADQFQTHR